MDDSDTLFHLHALGKSIPDPDASLVFGMRLVVGIQTTTIGLLEILVGFFCGQSVKRELQMTQVVGVGTIDILECRISGLSLVLTIA